MPMKLPPMIPETGRNRGNIGIKNQEKRHSWIKSTIGKRFSIDPNLICFRFDGVEKSHFKFDKILIKKQERSFENFEISSGSILHYPLVEKKIMLCVTNEVAKNT